LLIAGLFYVIEGFLDILLPIERKTEEVKPDPSHPGPRRKSRAKRNNPEHQKLLFTVKPGGIAGYLGEYLSNL
jgi:lysophospholipid hydrolase